MSSPFRAAPSHASLPLVMSFAATDPTGGAGLQADLLTIASLGCYPLSVVTGITVQDTSGVERIEAVEADLVEDQARRLLSEMRVSAFKLGVLGSLANIEVIASLLKEHPDIPLVVDPVLASGRGDPLSTAESVQATRELLLPRATVVTPNSMEARVLADVPSAEDSALDEAARRLVLLGCRFVLITGTHEADAEVINTLYGTAGVIRADRWTRLPGSYHGSGCTLASAIAANIARGIDVPHAVQAGQEFTWHALSHALRPGKGQYLPDRMFGRNHTGIPK